VLAASPAAHMHDLRAEVLLDMTAKDSRSLEDWCDKGRRIADAKARRRGWAC